MTSQIAGAPPPDSDPEADLEVDQLDSDSEINELSTVDEVTISEDVTNPSAPRTRLGERSPGHTILPATRVENMIQADGVTGSMTLSKEALFVLSVATEDFIKAFVQAGHREASAHRRNQIHYLDMAGATQQYQEFMFLGDNVPYPISLTDALMLRQEKEREMLEDNPALAHLSPFPAWIPSISQTTEFDVPKPKKIRNTNGEDYALSKDLNGQLPLQMDAETPDSFTHRLSPQNPLEAVPKPQPYGNGTESPFVEPINTSSPHLPVHYPGAHSPPYHGEDDSQWSGPAPLNLASGTAQEPSSSFSPPQNGRTIYSQSDSTSS